MKTFEELGVSEEIRHAIEELGFEQPMPVQEAVIPYLLGNGNDVIALAQTGTGKTAAYGIPVLQKIDPTKKETQALILSPTRELCLQIADDISDFSKYIDGLHVAAVYGGASIEMQSRQLRKGAQIIVATPGRLIDLMKRGVAKLDAVCNVVLDEADEMLNMGFVEDIEKILTFTNEDKRMLFFSATMPDEIMKVAKNHMKEYEVLAVKSRELTTDLTEQIYFEVNERDKFEALCRIIDLTKEFYGIIFCRTKTDVNEIVGRLNDRGYDAEGLHGDIGQNYREVTLKRFKTKKINILVATDVAARGIDINDLSHVINYAIPQEVESYVHRIF